MSEDGDALSTCSDLGERKGAEAGESILKSRLFADNKVAALHRGSRQSEVGIATEPPLVVHLQSDAISEHRNSTGDLLGFMHHQSATGAWMLLMKDDRVIGAGARTTAHANPAGPAPTMLMTD